MEEATHAMVTIDEAAQIGKTSATDRAKQPKKARRLLTMLLLLASVLIAADGAALAVYFTPIHTVERFCQAVAAQDDGRAYQLLTTRFQRQHSLEQFARDMQVLDNVAGRATGCGGTSITSPISPDMLMGELVVTTKLRRGHYGEMRGQAQLRVEDGAWRIDRVDASLMGVDLGALDAASLFCDALRRQNYGAVYTLLTANRPSTTTELDFTAQGRAWDQIGGQVSACGVASIEPSSSNTRAQLTISVTRTRAGLLGGVMTLARGDEQWAIQALDQTVLGADLGPLVVGQQFCTNLSNGMFHNAYLLLSRSLRMILPEHDGRWQSYTALRMRWSCIPDFATYTVGGNRASYVVMAQVINNATGKTATLPRLLFMFVHEDGAWMLDNINAPAR